MVTRPRPLLALLLGGVLAVAGCGEPPRVPVADDGPAPVRTGYDATGRALGPVPADARRPNVVMVIIDTLRADALAHMPYLRSLAAQGVMLPDAVAPSSWTLPSVTSLVTGLLPSTHGADTPGDRRTLPAALTTYPEIFKRTLGYDTAGFFGGLWFSDAMGTLQGFDTRRYDFLLQGTEAHVGRWKERRRATAPHLLVLHTFEAHEPYGARNHPWPPRAGVHPLATAAAPTAGTDRWEELVGYFTDRDVRDAVRGARDREALARIVHWMQHGCEEDPRPDALARLREAYEAGAAWVDGLLRNTCSWLEAEGLLDDDTILIVTSDHGEAFGEEGLIGHGRGLQDELVRIPLVIRGPAPFRGGKIVRGPFGLIDVFPTLLDWMGMPPMQEADGRSHLAALEGSQELAEPVVCEVRAVPHTLGEDRSWVRAALRSERWRWEFRYDLGDGTVEERVTDLGAPARQATTVLAPDTPLPGALRADAVFCAAIERMRARWWAEAEQTAGRAFSLYGVNVGPLVSKRPPPCTPRPAPPR